MQCFLEPGDSLSGFVFSGRRRHTLCGIQQRRHEVKKYSLTIKGKEIAQKNIDEFIKSINHLTFLIQR